MSDLSGELTVIRVTVWWLQKLAKDWHRSLMWRDLISGKLRELEVRKQYKIKISNRFAAL
jgi:hypothetical protein